MACITKLFLLVQLVCAGVFAKKYVGDGESAPWGDRTAKESHPQQDVPDTGETRYYDLTISRQTMAPDGTEMSLLVANGQFPGPTIEANWGDYIQVTINNQIYGPEESTTIHWHGLNQPGTPWYDGVPSVGQCPIVPGSSLTVRFRADEYGTSWWHSHLSAQYTQGLFGPIVIHGPSEYADYDEDLGPVLINDWYHDYYSDIVDQVNAPVAAGTPPPIPRSQSNLVNGAGAFQNSSSYAKWKVEPGKKYRMRLINAGSVAFESVSIDNHKIKIIANDFIPVQPYDVDFVTLAVGQRTDIVFEASGESGQSYWFRAWNDPLCGQTDGPDGRGIISYCDGDSAAEPTSTGLPIPPNTSCHNDDLSLTVPVYQDPVKEPDVTITITIAPIPDANGVFKWTMNGVGFQGDASAPLLFQTITQDSTAFPRERNVYDLGSNQTVRVILVNTFVAPHPMHIHGHDFQVLASGPGTWDGTIVRPENPQRRDTQMMEGGTSVPSYIVIQWAQDNPGIWPLHCHTAWHLSAGMMVLMLERPDELVNFDAGLPAAVVDTCAAYKTWAAANDCGNDDTC